MPSVTPPPPFTQFDPARPDQKLPSLYDFFHPGGILAQSSLAFEHRPGQYAMAREIEQCFADRRHLIVEAGTGTGKTLAYLLPAIRSASSSPPGRRIYKNSSTSKTSPSSKAFSAPSKSAT